MVMHDVIVSHHQARQMHLPMLRKVQSIAQLGSRPLPFMVERSLKLSRVAAVCIHCHMHHDYIRYLGSGGGGRVGLPIAKAAGRELSSRLPWWGELFHR